jgi:hypothetical protein
MAPLPQLRRLLLTILLIGLVGSGVELLLLKHDETPVQFVPLVSIGLALVAIAWDLARPSRASLLALRIVMTLFLVAGFVGIYMHFRANLQYQREFDATLHGAALAWHALRAKVPPALAPGVMLQLGLIGLAYTYGRKGERT